MKPSKGYYSLIQYCPDLGRLESANVGVLLFCPERNYLCAQITAGNRRIIQFFGSEGHDWPRINALKKGLVDRICLEQAEIQTLDDLKRFIALRANLLQITDPRPMQVTDPDADLKRLVAELLGEAHRERGNRNLKRRLADKLLGAGLDRKLHRDLHVKVPVLDRELEVPFGFQNGRFNLITPVRFEAAKLDQALNTSFKYAVEGRSLYEHPDERLGRLQLVVVGKFRPNDRESPERVERVLRENAVKLYRFSQLPELIDEIRETGKDLAVS